MAGLPMVSCGVVAGTRITASDMPAREASAEAHPAALAGAGTVLARRRRDRLPLGMNLVDVFARRRHPAQHTCCAVTFGSLERRGMMPRLRAARFASGATVAPCDTPGCRPKRAHVGAASRRPLLAGLLRKGGAFTISAAASRVSIVDQAAAGSARGAAGQAAAGVVVRTPCRAYPSEVGECAAGLDWPDTEG